jgi:hypothetical protein
LTVFRLRFNKGMAGAVAQLGERGVRNAEVRGSIPLRSTRFIPNIINNLLIALTV